MACLKINLVLHASVIKQVLAAHDDGRFFSLEENSPVIHLYGQTGKLLDTFRIPRKPFSEHKVCVVQAAYDPAADVLGYLSTDRSLYFFEALRKQSLLLAEDTFASDVPLEATTGAIEQLAGKAWAAAQRETERTGRTVVLKLKTSDFRILTRSHTPAHPPATLAEVIAIALDLRSRVELPARVRYRLVGVGLANFRRHDELPPQARLFQD